MSRVREREWKKHTTILLLLPSCFSMLYLIAYKSIAGQNVKKNISSNVISSCWYVCVCIICGAWNLFHFIYCVLGCRDTSSFTVFFNGNDDGGGQFSFAMFRNRELGMSWHQDFMFMMYIQPYKAPALIYFIFFSVSFSLVLFHYLYRHVT